MCRREWALNFHQPGAAQPLLLNIFRALQLEGAAADFRLSSPSGFGGLCSRQVTMLHTRPDR